MTFDGGGLTHSGFSCDDLLAICGNGVVAIREWFDGVRSDRFKFWISQEEREAPWKKQLSTVQKIKDEVSSVLEHFRNVSRYPAFPSSVPPHKICLIVKR